MIMNVDNELIFHSYVVSMTEKGMVRDTMGQQNSYRSWQIYETTQLLFLFI